MWEPRRLTTLWAFTAHYRDTFTFLKRSAYGTGSKLTRAWLKLASISTRDYTVGTSSHEYPVTGDLVTFCLVLMEITQRVQRARC
jgi:hypothetical protein